MSMLTQTAKPQVEAKTVARVVPVGAPNQARIPQNRCVVGG